MALSFTIFGGCGHVGLPPGIAFTRAGAGVFDFSPPVPAAARGV
jgi:hypothetical protein